jgi:SAM-dependent methyltransferase
MAATVPAENWREALDSWRIPEQIRSSAAESPWILPVRTFEARAREQLDTPSGASYDAAVQALPDKGSVLDVGAGAGAAGLALRHRAGTLTAVDESERMLAALTELATGHGLRVRTVVGSWPQVAPEVEPADVVLCHHVLYNVAELDPFIAALTAHAHRRVVVELSARHPMSVLNPLWQRLHGIERPTRPTAIDAVEVIAGTGARPRWRTWSRPATRDGSDFADLVAVTAQRLCVGPDRTAEVEEALRDLGVGPDHPFLGSPDRELVTIWWDIP